MFRGTTNPYDDIVTKTTDENLTSENWELIMNLCDKVIDEGEQGARNVIAAVLKRLAHRNPNVQLYALSLAESLSKNCTIELHREIASRAFTQGLEKLITDRTTHEKVKRRALVLIAMWTDEFEKDPTLGIMEECYTNLKSKGYKFEAPQEQPPPTVDDEVRRREEEELQKVLAMSIEDKGGRAQWAQYTTAGGSASGAGASAVSGSGSGPARNATAGSSSTQAPAYTSTGGTVPYSSTEPTTTHTAPPYSSGYVAARSPSPAPAAQQPPATTAATPQTAPSTEADDANKTSGMVTRVRALYTFESTEAGELAFEKGDIIKVVDRGYKDWWRGQLKGRTGIFPVNYVEPLPEPTAAELAAEAAQEHAIFSQAANVDRLLARLRALDPAKDNLADDEEVQELYRSCMALRPKIVKLIDKYSQKRADLVSMNDSFVRARTIFDQMMEESLARHTGMYDSRPPYRPAQSGYPNSARPDSRATHGAPQSLGWNPAVYDQPGYNAYPVPYQGPPQGQDYPPQHGYPAQDGAAYGQSPYPPQQQGPEGAPYPPQPYGQQQQGAYPQQPYGGPQQQPGAPYSGYPQGQHGTVPPGQPQPGQPQAQAPGQTPQPGQPQPHVQGQPLPQQGQPQYQPQAQPQHEQQPQQQTPPQQQQQTQPQQAQPAPAQSGPPYTYDPNGTYPDQNAQAWASYYAQGGKDPTGAVYFHSVPGVTDVPPAQGEQPQPQAQPQQQPEPQVHQQQQPSFDASTGAVPQAQGPAPTSPTGAPGEGYVPFHANAPAAQSTTSVHSGYNQAPPQAHDQPPPHAIPSSPTSAHSTTTPWSGPQGSPPQPYQPPQAQAHRQSFYAGQPHPNPNASPYAPVPGQEAYRQGTTDSQDSAWSAQYKAVEQQMAHMGVHRGPAPGPDGPAQEQGQAQYEPQPGQHVPGVGAPA